MSMGKKALMLGLCGAVLSAAVLLIEKKNREKKFNDELWEVEEDDDAEIEFTMSAGEIDEEEIEGFDEEEIDDFDDFVDFEELPELEVVGVVLTGPRTARVRPTEEEEKEMQNKQDAVALAEKLKSISLTLTVKCGENGRLFGSINTKDIADALEKQAGLKVDKRKIELGDAIKSLGSYKLKVKLHRDVAADLTLKVVEA